MGGSGSWGICSTVVLRCCGLSYIVRASPVVGGVLASAVAARRVFFSGFPALGC